MKKIDKNKIKQLISDMYEFRTELEQNLDLFHNQIGEVKGSTREHEILDEISADLIDSSSMFFSAIGKLEILLGDPINGLKGEK